MRGHHPGEQENRRDALCFRLRAGARVLLVALGGCELLKKDGESLAVINKRVLGMPAGDFFDRYGRARTRNEVADKTTEYDWVSAVGTTARPGPEALDDRICRLRLVSRQERPDQPCRRALRRAGAQEHVALRRDLRRAVISGECRCADARLATVTATSSSSAPASAG